MKNLEEKLQRAYAAGISAENQVSIERYLGLLKQKEPATHAHSVRVGILASNIGEFLHLDSRALLYAGLLHDVGKLLINVETLTKTEGFDQNDYEQIKQHPVYSYQLLRGVHDFSADIVVRHHKHQPDAYPENLPDYSKPYNQATRATIDFYARILALADFYDAASTRINEKHGEKKALTKAEIKTLMFVQHPHFKKLINDLYQNGIFEEK